VYWFEQNTGIHDLTKKLEKIVIRGDNSRGKTRLNVYLSIINPE